MATIQHHLTAMVNRTMDAVYLACIELKLPEIRDVYFHIMEKIEDYAFVEIYKQYSVRPYKKRQFLDQEISEINPEENLKEYINILSLSIRDTLVILEGHKENISRVKNPNALKTSFLKNYKDSLNNLSSHLLAYQDFLLELQECNDENEMNDTAQKFLNNKS